MDILNSILNARDTRYKLRKTYSGKNKLGISLTLNIPGYPKSDRHINTLFDIVLNDLIIHLKANRVIIDLENSTKRVDDAGDFFIGSILSNNHNVYEIKDLCEEFEDNFFIPRIVDVDITDESCNNISSKKEKKCYICKDVPAVECMRENRHTKKQLRDYLFEQINSYLEKHRREDIYNKLFKFALKSILYEVSLTPKPGLVDTLNSGVHKDMDYFTYINSSSAISYYFIDIIKIAYSFDKSLKYALPEIRKIGLKMEDEMFMETGGVNTQKGIIFLFGISLFAIAYTLGKSNYFDMECFINTVKSITYKLSASELAGNSLIQSHGEKCYKKFGLNIGGGIRNEVELGFPILIKYSLPVLRNELKNKKIIASKYEDIREPLITTLITIIANNNDTNVLYRGGIEKSDELKKLSFDYLNTDKKSKKKEKYSLIINFCKDNNVSPGGSADLLALSILLFLVEEEFRLN